MSKPSGQHAAVSGSRPTYQLRIVSGPGQGQVVPLQALPFTLGRKQACDLPCRAEDVSLVHCVLLSEGGRLFVADQDTTNGTWLDGTRLRGRAPLAAGSRLRLGRDTELRLEACDGRGGGAAPAGSGAALVGADRPWGRRLLARVTCPSCWHAFPPEDVFFVAGHPDLLGDPALGDSEYLRFQPTRFTLKGEAVDPRGFPSAALACPRCRLSLPEALLELPPLFVSVLGAPASGKSYYLTALTWELRHVLPRLGLAFSDADPRANVVVHDYERALFLNPQPDRPTDIPKTQPDDPRLHRRVRLDGATIRYPVPLQFTMAPTAPGSSRPGRVVVLYDNAGEDFLPGAESAGSAATAHLSRLQLLLFLFDPLQDPRFTRELERVRPGAASERAPTTGGGLRQEVLLQHAGAQIRRHLGLSEQERTQKPLLLVIPKADAWGSLLAGHDLLREPLAVVEGQGEAVDVARIEAVSQDLRTLLTRTCPELVATAERLSSVVRYLPVSSLGRGPEWVEQDGRGFFGVRPRDVRPAWVTAPLLYCFALADGGLVPSVSAACPAS